MIIGFTGTREGMSRKQYEGTETTVSILSMLANVTHFHHGDCKGADEEADGIARKYDCVIHIHPPENNTHRACCYQTGDYLSKEKPYLTRNEDIVKEVQVLIAAPFEMDKKKGGTWHTIEQARKKGIPIIIIDHKGNFHNG
jgi:hypothetical protein